MFQARRSHLYELEKAALPLLRDEFADSASESAEVDMISGNVNCLEREGKSAVLGGAVNLSEVVEARGGGG